MTILVAAVIALSAVTVLNLLLTVRIVRRVRDETEAAGTPYAASQPSHQSDNGALARPAGDTQGGG